MLGFTGHRLKHFDGDPDHVQQRLYDMAIAVLKRYQPDAVVSGMEPTGWDMAAAKAAKALEIPLIAAIPFPAHAKMYPQLLAYAKQSGEFHYINQDPYAAWKMHRRNEWIVDHCDKLIALWSGQAGGTAHTWMYAEQVDRERVNLWQNWLKYAKG